VRGMNKEDEIYKVICPQCGSVSIVGKDISDESGNWLECSVPQGFEWRLPAGKITPVVGAPIYVSAIGEALTRDQYLGIYSIDPEIAYQNMRRRPKGVQKPKVE